VYYYIINDKIKGYEKQFDSALYSYPELTEGQKTFYESNPDATLQEVLNEALTVKTAEELLNDAIESKLSDFNQWLREQQDTPITVNLPSGAVAELKPNEQVESNLTKQSNGLDKMFALHTKTGGQAGLDESTIVIDILNYDLTTTSVSYTEYLMVLGTMFDKFNELYIKSKGIPAQINACTTIEEVNAIAWE
jgi:hypothetical protein